MPDAAQIRRYLATREAREAAKARLVEAEKELLDTEQTMWDDAEREGLTSITQDVGPPYGKVQLVRRETVTARVLAPDLFEDWAKREQRDDEMIEAKPRKRPLNELVRESLRNGESLPDGVDFTARRYFSVTQR